MQIIEENIGSSLSVLDVTDKENGSYIYSKIQELVPKLNIKIIATRALKKNVYKMNKDGCLPDLILLDYLINDSTVSLVVLSRLFFYSSSTLYSLTTLILFCDSYDWLRFVLLYRWITILIL